MENKDNASGTQDIEKLKKINGDAVVEGVLVYIKKLQEQNQQLKEQNQQLEGENQQLKGENKPLEEKKQPLEEKNQQLEKIINQIREIEKKLSPEKVPDSSQADADQVSQNGDDSSNTDKKLLVMIAENLNNQNPEVQLKVARLLALDSSTQSAQENQIEV